MDRLVSIPERDSRYIKRGHQPSSSAPEVSIPERDSMQQETSLPFSFHNTT